MPKLLYTVQNVVDEIRSQTDELNTDSVNSLRDILPAANRAQDYAFDIYARRYPEPILKYATLLLNAGQEYDIPEEVFEDRIMKIEIRSTSASSQNQFRDVERVSYQDISDLESEYSTAIPSFYVLFGRKIRFLPAPSGTYNARLWYLRAPEKLVLPQGRIQIINSTSNYVIVDSPGTAITTESDQLASYVNVVDGQSGEIKGSLQIASISDNKVLFKTVPTRASVLNRAISGSLVSIPLQQDDYICAIDGSCVPYYGRPTTNFIIQFVVNEITRKLGGNAQEEAKVLELFEKQVEKSFVGRPQAMRMRKTNSHWNKTFSKNFFLK